MHRARAAYYAYLAYLDAQVGRLMRILMRGGHRNTFVLFTSDHGEMLGDHNLWRKTYAYEASARVPFVIKMPASIEGPRNRELSQVVGWEDIMPTFLDLAEAPIPKTVEGRSLMPLLRGENGGWRNYYHGEHSACYHPENTNQFLTDGEWKYIWNPATDEEQLFHLETDPQECQNLAKQAKSEKILILWRERMVEELKDRGDGLSDGERLIPGAIPAWVGGDAGEVHLG
jgi:arylsulfatase A-like enzyme